MSTENTQELEAPAEATPELAEGNDGLDNGEQVGEAEGGEAAEGEESTGKPKPEGNKTPPAIQQRFDRLTAQKYELARQVQQMQDEIAQLRSAYKEPEKSRNDFLTDDDWEEYRVQQSVQKAFQTQQQQQQQHMQQQMLTQRKQQIWSERVQATAAEIPDYLETVQAASVSIPPQAAEFIQASDIGPKLVYELAKNPQAADELWSMDERAMERKLLKMELRLENSAPAPQQRPSSAPAPVKQGKGKPQVTSMEDLPIEEWMARRNKQVFGR